MERGSIDSWLEAPDPLPSTLLDRLQLAWWYLKTWYQETTDIVVLNSPWLRRRSGKLFRCFWIAIHMLGWCLLPGFYSERGLVEADYFGLDIRIWCVLMPSLLAPSLCMSAICKRESLVLSLVAPASLFFSSFALDTIIRGDVGHMARERALVNTFVVCFHCNVHPLGMFVALCASSWAILHILQMDRSVQQELYDIIVAFYALGFQYLGLCFRR